MLNSNGVSRVAANGLKFHMVITQLYRILMWLERMVQKAPQYFTTRKKHMAKVMVNIRLYPIYVYILQRIQIFTY